MGLHENKQVRSDTCIYLAFHVHKFALILTALNSIKDHQLVRGLALKMPSENKNPHPSDCFPTTALVFKPCLVIAYFFGVTHIHVALLIFP